jgi:N-acetyl-gamma-glutamyl-phosphate reductase
MTKRMKVAVLGASGYTGGELLRLLAGHPFMEVSVATSEKSVGLPVATSFPHLAGVYPFSFSPMEPETIAHQVDAVFLALPHTKSAEPANAFIAAGKRVVDLSADYRLKDVKTYEAWYQTVHPYPNLLPQAVYGLPELHRDRIRTSLLVASPGCYPTAAILQLAPLLSRRLVQRDSIIIDAKSGVSGAGRSPSLSYHFPEVHESLEAYKIGRHRHIPEIEQELSALLEDHVGTAGMHASGNSAPLTVTFSPHLVPMNRGILSTAYCRLQDSVSLHELKRVFADFYKDELFIRLKEGDSSANPGHVRGSNYCDLAVFTDSRAGWVITTAALDNLVKGAAGQAIQAMNLMLGLPEDSGLRGCAVFP